MDDRSVAEARARSCALGLAWLALLAVPGLGWLEREEPVSSLPPADLGGVFAPLLVGAGIEPPCANADVWQAVPGIGPSRARALVEEQRRDPFRVPRDLERVHGIGPKSVAAISPWLSPPPWPPHCEGDLD